VRGEKILATLANEFVFVLANTEFYSHLASWRVVIRNPAITTESKIPNRAEICNMLAIKDKEIAYKRILTDFAGITDSAANYTNQIIKSTLFCLFSQAIEYYLLQ
jgi:hypothetical protein